MILIWQFGELALDRQSYCAPKEKRQLNLILLNIEESIEEEPLSRKKDDINKVTSLFTEYIGVETTVTE